MPYVDPELKKASDKARYLRVLSDPVALEEKRRKAREYYRKNRAQLIRYHREEERKRRDQNKLEALTKFGPGGVMKCSWPGCDVADPDMLTLDHVNNDGRVRRAAGEGRGNGIYRRVKRGDVEGLQTLCANHNLKKEILRRKSLLAS